MENERNTDAKRRNTLADLRWYAWRLVHFYRLNGGLPVTRDAAINILQECKMPLIKEKDVRLVELVKYYAELKDDDLKNLKQTETRIREAWCVCHDFDETLRGAKLPTE